MNAPHPLVSVIMPAYNAGPYVAESIRSVLSQDYPNLELIIVDDGSSDNTVAEIQKFGDRVRLLRQANAGPAAARNRAAQAAKGEFLAFMDADDVWVQGKTRAQVAYLARHPEIGIVFGRIVRWHGSRPGEFPPPPVVPEVRDGEDIVPEESGWIYPQMLLDSVIWIVSALLPRAAWLELGGLDESLSIGEDYDFFIRASRRYQIAELDQVVAIYRIHPVSTTHVVRTEDIESRVVRNALQRFGTHAPDGRPVDPLKLRERQYQLSFSFGYRHIRNGDPRIARRAFQEALRHCQWRLKAWIYLVLASAKTLAAK